MRKSYLLEVDEDGDLTLDGANCFCKQIFRWWTELSPVFTKAKKYKLEISTENNGGEDFLIVKNMFGIVYFFNWACAGRNEFLNRAQQIFLLDFDMDKEGIIELRIFVNLEIVI
jgi:hypothetical protein